MRCPHCNTSFVGQDVPAHPGSYICPACGQYVPPPSTQELCWFCGKRTATESATVQVWLRNQRGLNLSESVVPIPRCQRCSRMHGVGLWSRSVVFCLIFAVSIAVPWSQNENGLMIILGGLVGLVLGRWVSRSVADYLVSFVGIPARRSVTHPLVTAHLSQGWQLGKFPRAS